MDILNIGIVIQTQSLRDQVQDVLKECPAHISLNQDRIGDWAQFLETLDKTQPDLLLVELGLLSDPLPDVIKQIKSTAGAPMVTVVHDKADSETLLRAIRASADEYLFPPLTNDLKAAITRLTEDRSKKKAGTKPRGKVLGFLSAKGGCGATSLVCHAAVDLAKQTGLEVLLADFDISAGMIGFLMKSHCRYSILDAVDNIHRLDLSFWKALVSSGTVGVDVIMSPPNPAAQFERRHDEFRSVLRFVRSNYDWTMVDLGRSITPLIMTVLEEMDETFLVTTLEIPALHQAKLIVQTLVDAGYSPQRLHLVINRMPRHADITMTELEAMLGLPVYTTIPDDYEALNEAYSENQLVSPKCAFGKGISTMATMISGQMAKKAKAGIFSHMF